MAKKTLVLLPLILLVFSCKKNVEKFSFSEVQVTTKNNDLVEVFIPKASENSKTGVSINSKIESFAASFLTIGNAEISDRPLVLTEQIDAFNEEFEAFKKDFPETPQHWDAQINGEVMFQSTEIISIAITAYLNTGGAHGNTTISFLNFDATTGKEIPKEKLFTDMDSFTTLAKQYFENAIKDKSVLFESDNFKLPANIGFLDEGIILLYNTYEIAPYTSGITEFIIPFEKANNYLVFHGP